MSLQAYLNQIKLNLNQIGKLLTKRLSKRGWFDIIGTGLHTLFGVMDSNDESYYNDLISQLQQQNKETLTLMKQNAHISKSVMNNLNETLSKFKRFEDSVSTNLQLLEKKLNEVISNQNEEKLTNLALQLHAQFLDYAIILQEETDTILNAINFSQLGILYSKILPIDIFEKELKQISIEDDKLLSDLFKINEISLYKIIKPEIKIGKEIMIISIHLPLVMNSIFQLYKVYSYPIHDKLNPQFHHMIQFHHPLIAYNNKKEYAFIPDLESCVQIESIWLCPHLEISTVQDDSPCEVLMKTAPKFPKQCDVQSLPLEISNSIYLEQNEWLYLTTKPQSTFCECDGKTVARMTIEKSSIIRLSPNCIAFIDGNTMLKAESRETKNKTLKDTIPLLEEDCCLQEIQKIAHLDLDPVKLSPDHINNINLLNEELDQFQEEIEKEYNKPLEHLRTSWWKYFLGLVASFLGTLCCCYMCCPRCLQFINPLRPCVVINQTINSCRDTQKTIAHRSATSSGSSTETTVTHGTELEMVPSPESRKKLFLFHK